MAKKVIFERIQREKILRGMALTSRLVEKSYGPRGRTVAFAVGNKYRMTKDGISIAKSLTLGDESEQFGASLLQEGASRANFMSGDGSSSTTILSYIFSKTANDLLNNGYNVNDIKAAFRYARDFVLEKLVEYKNSIKDENDIYKIALISANNDEEIAKFVKEAFTSIGDNGIVAIGTSQSRTGETAVRNSSGTEFDKGYMSSKAANNPNDQCIFNDPYIFLSNITLESVDDIKPILEHCKLHKNPLVFVAPYFSDDVSAFFTNIISNKTQELCYVLAPGSDKFSIENKLCDLAVMLNAKVLGSNVELSQFSFDTDFGKCKQIIISRNKTQIIEAETDEEKFDEYIKNLQNKINNQSVEQALSEFEIESLKERIAKMTGGIATILVGAITQTEMDEKIDRYEDAVNAVRQSIENGYIPGAQTPLLRISYEKIKEKDLTVPELEIVKAYLRALRYPAKLLINSAGEDPEIQIPKLISKKKTFGFDASKIKICDLLLQGIIDPYNIIVNSIVYASNIAEQFLMCDAIVVNDNPNVHYETIDPILDENRLM